MRSRDLRGARSRSERSVAGLPATATFVEVDGDAALALFSCPLSLSLAALALRAGQLSSHVRAECVSGESCGLPSRRVWTTVWAPTRVLTAFSLRASLRRRRARGRARGTETHLLQSPARRRLVCPCDSAVADVCAFSRARVPLLLYCLRAVRIATCRLRKGPLALCFEKKPKTNRMSDPIQQTTSRTIVT